MISGVMYYLTVTFLLDLGGGGDHARCWCLIAYGENMTKHKSKTDPSLKKKTTKKTLLLIHSGGDHVHLLPKHKVSKTIPRLQPEIAVLIHLSLYKELSFLGLVTQAQRLI